MKLGKNIGQQYCWCSLMWLMPLRSLSNCDYELKNLPRMILGPIHSNQVMGMDPVGSHHGTRNSRSNSIIRPIHINRTTKNATAAHTCAPSPKQSTRDWIRVPGEIVWAWSVCHPARLATSTAHGC